MQHHKVESRRQSLPEATISAFAGYDTHRFPIMGPIEIDQLGIWRYPESYRFNGGESQDGNFVFCGANGDVLPCGGYGCVFL